MLVHMVLGVINPAGAQGKELTTSTLTPYPYP